MLKFRIDPCIIPEVLIGKTHYVCKNSSTHYAEAIRKVQRNNISLHSLFYMSDLTFYIHVAEYKHILF